MTIQFKKNIEPVAINNKTLKLVSEYRRQQIELKQQDSFDKNGSLISPAGYVIAGAGIKKRADLTTSNSSLNSNWRGSGGSANQHPELYSPLWMTSNLNFPRDRATINAWSRAFFAMWGIVQNPIFLHSTYPISKLNIKCKGNPKIEQFFAEQIEELDLMNVCCQIAQEYWLLGEAYPYAEYDENAGKWSRIVLQNPDYITVRHSIVGGEPIISLRPDSELKRICLGGSPEDARQRQQLNPAIVEYVKRGEDIPLDSISISQIARKIAPYEIRGTGLPVSCFKPLMLLDKINEAHVAQASNMINPLTLVKIGGNPDYKPTPADLELWRDIFACHDEETEILTNDGFKKYNEVIDYTEEVKDGKFVIANVKPKENIKIACFNKENERLEYYSPSAAHLYNYSGEMYHFFNKKIDLKVTPNHKLFVSKKEYQYNSNRSLKKEYWGEWQTIEAQNYDMKKYHRFRSKINWAGENKDFVQIGDKNIPIKLYLKFLGYFLSDGWLTTNNKKYKTENKIIPSWVKSLNKDLLQIFLNALVLGDGSAKKINKSDVIQYIYYSTSKQLADDVYEIVYKCGYVPTLFIKYDKRPNRLPIYTVSWSENKNGIGIATKVDFPCIYKNARNPIKKTSHSVFEKEQYSGKVWCFTVPTGLFISRRNGKITIQGNSAQNNPDYKIFTHEAVTIDRIGYNSGILDTSNMEDRLLKFIYIGLMVPQVLMDGGSDTTYSNGSVALDVLKQRYMTFRNMLSAWLRKKIFAPIAKANKFYEKKEGKNVLIVPEIDWNHMFLFDTTEYIQLLKEMVTGEKPLASKQTLYRSLGLDHEEERRRIKQEMIEDAIAAKEMEAIANMPLNELRALNPTDEIQEPIDALLPGQNANGNNQEMSLPGIPAPESQENGGDSGASSPPPPPPPPQ